MFSVPEGRAANRIQNVMIEPPSPQIFASSAGLKARDIIAQGNALGSVPVEMISPERAEQSLPLTVGTEVAPFQGWENSNRPITWGFTPGCHITGLQPCR